MSATMPPPGVTRHNGHQTLDDWRDNARVFLQPIAAPSILGLFGFAGATFIVASNLAGWYGTGSSPDFLFPFAAVFGGLAQFAAGMWAYRARDGLATAMHGMWGSFWIAYGLLFLLAATGTITLPTGSFPELGFWFIALSVITFSGTIAATAENVALTMVLLALAVGAGFLAVANLTGTHWWEEAGGYIRRLRAVRLVHGDLDDDREHLRPRDPAACPDEKESERHPRAGPADAPADRVRVGRAGRAPRPMTPRH